MNVRPMDLSARVDGRNDHNGKPCALLKVQFTLDGAEFEGNIVGSVDRHVNEYWVYMTAGSKVLYVKHPRLLTLEVNFADYDISNLDSRVTYQLVLSAPLPALQETYPVVAAPTIMDSTRVAAVLPQTPVVGQIPAVTAPVDKENSTKVYIEGKFQAGSLMAVGGGIGTYIKRFNLEAYFLSGMGETDEVFWLPSDKTQTAYAYTYTASTFGAKLGFAIPCSDFFRITPQLGVGVASVSGSETRRGTGTDPKATDAYALPVSIGVRAELIFGGHFGISVSPEYSFAVSSSDTFTRLSDVCSDVKSFGQGFNARVGVFVCF